MSPKEEAVTVTTGILAIELQSFKRGGEQYVTPTRLAVKEGSCAEIIPEDVKPDRTLHPINIKEFRKERLSVDDSVTVLFKAEWNGKVSMSISCSYHVLCTSDP